MRLYLRIGGGAVALGLALLVGYCNAPWKRVAVADIHAMGGEALQLRDGRQLEYFEWGNRSEGGGHLGKKENLRPILLLTHGGFSTGLTSKLLAVKMQERFHVIAPSMPGFGGSSSHNGRTLVSFGEDVAELLRALDIEETRPVAIMGYSWGGPHALAVAHSLAAGGFRVTRVVLLAPAWLASPDFAGWTALMGDPQARMVHHTVLGTPYLNRVFMQLVMRPMFLGDDKAAVFKALNVDSTEDWEEFVGFLQYSVRHNLDGMPDLAELAQRVRVHLDLVQLGHTLRDVPVHVFQGDKDDVVIPANAEYIMGKLRAGGHRNVQYEVMPGFGHMSFTVSVQHRLLEQVLATDTSI